MARGTVGCKSLSDALGGADELRERAAAEYGRLNALTRRVTTYVVIGTSAVALILCLAAIRNIVIAVPLVLLAALAHAIWVRWTWRGFTRQYVEGPHAASKRAAVDESVLRRICQEKVAPFLDQGVRSTPEGDTAFTLHRIDSWGRPVVVRIGHASLDVFRRLLGEAGVRVDGPQGSFRNFLTACALRLDEERVKQEVASASPAGADPVAAFVAAFGMDEAMTAFLQSHLNQLGEDADWTGLRAEMQRAKERLDVARLEHQLAQERRIARDGVTLEMVDAMHWRAFEHFVGMLFEADGYEYEKTRAVGDAGSDGILVRDGVRISYQSKLYSKSVTGKAVQEAVASKPMYGCQVAWVITNQSFTPDARRLAEANDVRLIDRDELGRLVDQFNQRAKSDSERSKLAELFVPAGDAAD